MKDNRKMLWKIIIEIVIILVFGVLLIFGISFWRYFFPSRYPIFATPSRVGLAYEKVEFYAPDKMKLLGWFVPAKETSFKTIIVCHGYQANKADVLDWSAFLQERYNLLFFDFRGHGESGGKYTSIGFHEIRDYLGAINYLKTEKKAESQKIGAIGFSMGAAVALMAAPLTQDIEAIVADSSYSSLDQMVKVAYRALPFSSFLTRISVLLGKVFFKEDAREISPQKAMENNQTPILLIHAETDNFISADNSRRIYEAADGPKELWLVPKAAHGEAYFVQQGEYERRVFEFFAKYLK